MSRNEHDASVARLRAALLALPAGARVRLAKPSSNLFRFGGRDSSPGLPTDGLDSVIAIDPDNRTAEVGGLITYEKLVAATLPHKLMPHVVPQLKTITLGGAVAGLGIESTSFRDGLPHESVLEMDVLTGSGEIVTVHPDDPLFRGLPNSYGSLGYAVRLIIDLKPVSNTVALEYRRFDDPDAAFAALGEIWERGEVDFLDGVAFGPGETYLSLGRFTDEPGPVSDYTEEHVYYKSLRRRRSDRLTVHDYLWRWDTDWFWCSAALGVQNPVIRRLWPQPLRRSDVYRRLVALDRRVGITRRIDALQGKRREAVIQDVEIPLSRAPEFLREFCANVPIRPLWLCPLQLSGERTWPLYPLDRGERYVNFGFWATAMLRPGQAPDHHNRFVENLVDELGGHKSLYSTVHYDRDEFRRRYGGEAYDELKQRYDPGARLPDLYDKVVTDSATR
ncbi:FAD-binding oxidoreductase [Stackebrandtia nassauensis]|uniref:Delta(24)-sterol reductase n=1 Tax=Stackebrandtia nassauensis (strain DSM 44728 / CIP 108903 / NRRL B-16338 / NBRC 102104 / LLR-40K-21) TaxID=446470 RepID=D3Q9U6_STANL|nr:FAD-binding oxidoreductase [Stackebrandtia nassauensis]ADD44642.1 FAD linked oxidase domain protein [Stackebrandtia nassauensis DSM 44728]